MRKRYIMNITYGVMAQLVERLVRNEEASGSNPLSSTKKYGWQLPSVFFVRLIVRTADLTAVRARSEKPLVKRSPQS